MPKAEIVQSRDATRELLDAIRSLLLEAFDDFTDDDWDHTLGGYHVVVTDTEIVSHAAVVPRLLHIGCRRVRTGYVEGVATRPGRQRQGLGALAMRRAAELIRAHFEVGALSTGSHAFYERLGWQRWRGPTFVRHGPSLVRTVDEDDAVMVLPIGRIREIDFEQPISCEAREGDDW